MKEDCYSTACRHADGSVTEIRVHISPEVRRCAEDESSDPEEMVKGCVWRFIWTKHQSDEIKGEVVNFTLDKTKFIELLSDLRRIAKAEKKSCRNSKANS